MELYISIYQQQKFLGSCNYCQIEIVSYRFFREMRFVNFNYASLDIEEFDDLMVEITYKNSQGSILPYSIFGIRSHEIYRDHNSLTVFGPIISADGVYYMDYDQHEIDMFHLFENNQSINWWGFNRDEKKAYLFCSGSFTGLSKRYSGTYFSVDCSVIREPLDFYFLLGESLCGTKGYMGIDSNTLEDCLIESYEKGTETNRTLCLHSHETLISCIGDQIFEEICLLFHKYGFEIQLV